MFLVQRIHKEAGENGEDIRETLHRGSANPDAALEVIKQYFADDEEFIITYSSATRRFSITPKSREDLIYNIVKKTEEQIIDG